MVFPPLFCPCPEQCRYFAETVSGERFLNSTHFLLQHACPSCRLIFGFALVGQEAVSLPPLSLYGAMHTLKVRACDTSYIMPLTETATPSSVFMFIAFQGEFIKDTHI